MRRRGFSLLAVLMFISLTLTLTLIELGMVQLELGRIARDKYRLAATAAATSGIEYATAMLKTHRWHGPAFTSPDLDGTGQFTVRVQGSTIVSEGLCGPCRAELRRALP